MIPSAIGLAAGILSGLLGIGGGPVTIPLLVAFMSLSQHEAHATSLAVIIPMAAAGSIPFIVEGRVDVAIALLLAAGSVMGAPLGARAMAGMHEDLLKIVFGVFLIAVAVRLLLI